MAADKKTTAVSDLMEQGKLKGKLTTKEITDALEDMDFDPAGVFESLTGVSNEDATSRDCMAVVMDMVTEKIKQLSKPAEGESSSGQSYTYVETDFIKALKYGYVIEIQERATRS